MGFLLNGSDASITGYVDYGSPVSRQYTFSASGTILSEQTYLISYTTETVNVHCSSLISGGNTARPVKYDTPTTIKLSLGDSKTIVGDNTGITLTIAYERYDDRNNILSFSYRGSANYAQASAQCSWTEYNDVSLFQTNTDYFTLTSKGDLFLNGHTYIDVLNGNIVPKDSNIKLRDLNITVKHNNIMFNEEDFKVVSEVENRNIQGELGDDANTFYSYSSHYTPNRWYKFTFEAVIKNGSANYSGLIKFEDIYFYYASDVTGHYSYCSACRAHDGYKYYILIPEVNIQDNQFAFWFEGYWDYVDPDSWSDENGPNENWEIRGTNQCFIRTFKSELLNWNLEII